jgi:tellurite resistance protein TehA-like permease
MATGIVSIAVRSVPALSDALMWISVGCYGVLVGLTLWRLIAFRAEMWRDLNDAERGFGYFTFVAGTDVLGTRLAESGWHGVAGGLLIVGVAGWLVLGYVVPWATTLRRAGPTAAEAASGIWFVWVVGVQSVAVLAATLDGTPLLVLVATTAWAIGVALYGGLAVLMVMRLTRRPMRPEELSPPYWVTMGATAITVVAATRVRRMHGAPAVHDLVAGVAVLFWSFGTWLIPALLAAWWWRHVRRRVPVRYTPAWWSVVFPLGMYAVASRDLGGARLMPYAGGIGTLMTWVAFAAWAGAFVALAGHLAVSVRRRGRAARSGSGC